MTGHVNTYPVQEVAKLIGIGPKKLFAFLREQKVLDKSNLPYQRYIDQGYLKVHRGHWNHITVGTKFYGRTEVTPNGIEWLSKLIEKNKSHEH